MAKRTLRKNVQNGKSNVEAFLRDIIIEAYSMAGSVDSESGEIGHLLAPRVQNSSARGSAPVYWPIR